MLSPLEQFEILNIFSAKCLYGFSNFNFILVFFFLLFSFIFIFFFRSYFIPNVLEYYFEKLYYFVLTLIVENIGYYYLSFFNFVFFIFLFILTCNLFGMIPYSYTLTSHLIFTFMLSFMCFFGITVIGFLHHGLRFFGLFLPNGCPLLLVPFLVLIEIISYLARVFSLAIRLFANIMAGHTLLKILSGFVWIMVLGFNSSFLVAFLPFSLICLITGMELAIAFLQSYVFTVLVTIYLNDALNLH